MNYPTQAIINLRTQTSLKKGANRIFKDMGLDMSTAINLFLHNVVNTQSIPFQIVTKNGYTKEQEINMLESVKDLDKLKSFRDVKSMMKYLED